MLIVIGGLPATGKTTIARALRDELGGLHVRIDTIEQAMVRAGFAREQLGAAGYAAGYALAEDALHQGFSVIAECVNPVAASRDEWLEVARRAGTPCIEVEMLCSDPVEHQHRAASRILDIPDLPNPTWDEIQRREYDAWTRDHVKVETAGRDVESCVAEVLVAIDN